MKHRIYAHPDNETAARAAADTLPPDTWELHLDPQHPRRTLTIIPAGTILATLHPLDLAWGNALRRSDDTDQAN